jgi:hypothetical protein
LIYQKKQKPAIKLYISIHTTKLHEVVSLQRFKK